jgi:hypothetical protein
MSNSNSVQIERKHSYAICAEAEIGERLRFELNVSEPMSPGLSKLVERLPELDHHDAPSIAPR